MSDDLTWAPAWRLREMIAAKEVSPVEVTDHFLARIEEFEPRLKAFIHLDPIGARQAAKKAEAAVMAGDDLGALHGVPMAVKSHTDVEGFPRPSLPIGFGGVAPQDALPVERIRRAGAVIVGLNSMPTFTDQGALDVDALARNPWDPTRTAGVSSAGAGASVAAGLLPVALGTDGGGSIRGPTAFNGLVGLHPTDRSVPSRLNPSHPEFHVGLTVGPIARDARDVATVLSVIAGPDYRDPVGLTIDLPSPTSELDKGAAGLRLAWSDDLGFARNFAVETTSQVIETVRAAAFDLRGLGAVVDETDEVWDSGVSAAAAFQAIFPDVVAMSPTPVAEEVWNAAADLRQSNWLRFRKLFDSYDLLLCPAQQSIAPTFDTLREWTSGAAVARGVFGSGMAGMAIYLRIFNWMAFPAAVVGCGFVDGMPVGLQIVGRPGSDAKILRLAHAFRQAFPRDERPKVS